MLEHKNMHNKKMRNRLSKLGALLSLACDDVTDAEQKVKNAKAKLYRIQQEIEQLYITLDEPFIYVME